MKALVSLFLALTLLGCATSPVTVPVQDQFRSQVQPLVPKDKALVYFYYFPKEERHFFTTTNWSSPVAVLEGGENGIEIAVLGCTQITFSVHPCGSYTWIELKPGIYTLTAMFDDHRGTGHPAPFTFAAGHTYYYEIVQAPAAYSQDLFINFYGHTVPDKILGMKYCYAWHCAKDNAYTHY